MDEVREGEEGPSNGVGALEGWMISCTVDSRATLKFLSVKVPCSPLAWLKGCGDFSLRLQQPEASVWK
jgi:hypothetical protein